MEKLELKCHTIGPIKGLTVFNHVESLCLIRGSGFQVWDGNSLQEAASSFGGELGYQIQVKTTKHFKDVLTCKTSL